MVVGSPIGSDNFVHNGALNVGIFQNDLFFRRLKLSFRICAQPKPLLIPTKSKTWLSRTVHPSLLVEHASAFDGKILDAYSTVVGEIPLSEDNLTEINLPLHKAGSGLRKVEFTSPIAYFSSVVNSFHLVGQLIPNVAADIKFFEDAVPVPTVEDAKSEVKSPSNFTSNVIHAASNLRIADDSQDLSQDSQATVSIVMRIHFYFKFQKPSRLAGYPVLRVRAPQAPTRYHTRD